MVVLEVYKRDDKTYTLYFRDSTGAVVDITGDTIYFTVKTSETDTDAAALIRKNVTSHTDPTNGETEIALSNTDTAITAGEYYFDIQRKHTTKITTLVKGTFKVIQDITIRTGATGTTGPA